MGNKCVFVLGWRRFRRTSGLTTRRCGYGSATSARWSRTRVPKPPPLRKEETKNQTKRTRCRDITMRVYFFVFFLGNSRRRHFLNTNRKQYVQGFFWMHTFLAACEMSLLQNNFILVLGFRNLLRSSSDCFFIFFLLSFHVIQSGVSGEVLEKVISDIIYLLSNLLFSCFAPNSPALGPTHPPLLHVDVLLPRGL